VVRSWSLAVLLLLAVAATAAAQAGPLRTFAHEPGRDTRSGQYPGDDGDDGNGDALADRVPGSFETFPLDVPAGTRAHGFTTRISWVDARVDLDLYVYRASGANRPLGAALASGTLRDGNSETASFTTGAPLPPGSYLIVVDNFCSADADVAGGCGIGADVPDEDAFTGQADLDNLPPVITLSGPDGGVTGQELRYTATATDPDGTVTGYRFDLDGDDLDEGSEATANTAEVKFDAPGTYVLGVRVTDDGGGVGTASRTLTIKKAPKAKPKPPIASASLRRPTFGGTRRHALVLRYRLRERSRVNVVLFRGKKRVRRVSAGVRERRTTYRVFVRPGHLRRGAYTLRLTVEGASGRRQVARLSARRT
jgi:PKD domain